jgi:hypothetical protein
VAAVRAAAAELRARRQAFADTDEAQAAARSIAMGIGATYACALLCEQGAWAASRGDGRTAAAARRMAARGLLPAGPPEDDALAMDEPLKPALSDD